MGSEISKKDITRLGFRSSLLQASFNYERISEISKKDITRLGFRSSLLQASFNYERMQAGGLTWALLPIQKKIYKDDKPGLSAAMKDNLEFINTHPNLVGFLMGTGPKRGDER